VAIDHPWPKVKPHFVLFPKRDLKDVASMTDDDIPYLLDCLSMVRQLVQHAGLRDYRVYTNGPGLQEIRYLHFHVSP
jgi:diadenosine tetraphosphate (Ap4A) HIT family hydrolase